MHKNKNEIRAYYEMHMITPKELAKLYSIPYRTIKHWIETENWEKSKAIKGLKLEKDDLLKSEFGTILYEKSRDIKKEIKQNLSAGLELSLDRVVLNNLLDSATEKALSLAMSSDFLVKNQVLSAMIAKDELMRMIQNRKEGEANPLIVASAEKVGGMFEKLNEALYSRDNKAISENIEEMTIDEINKKLLDLN